jgi:hypothetical protein
MNKNENWNGNEGFYEEDEPVQDVIDAYKKDVTGAYNYQTYRCEHFSVGVPAGGPPWCYMCNGEMKNYQVTTSTSTGVKL